MSGRPPPPPPNFDVRPAKRRWPVILVAILAPIVSIIVISGVGLQMSGWQSFYIASGAMVPTLVVHDYIFVDRHAYGGDRLPAWGDIVVFYAPSSLLWAKTAGGRAAPFVKRVMALPGDRIQMIDGVPVLNGQPLAGEFVGSYVDPIQKRPRSVVLREHVPGGPAFEVLKTRQNGPMDNSPVFLVPPGAYFVMGDNRDDSLDSRSTAGPAQVPGWYVPLANIIGRANYIYWSGFDRLSRIGTALK